MDSNDCPNERSCRLRCENVVAQIDGGHQFRKHFIQLYPGDYENYMGNTKAETLGSQMTVFSFAGFLMLLGSVIDIFCHYTGKNFKGAGFRILGSFSFISNFKKLTNTSTASSDLGCLHGIRFLTMSWIILGHSYLAVVFQMHSLPENFEEYLQAFSFQAIYNATVAVDTFFLITGLLVCYSITKLVKIRGMNLNVAMYVIHRLWRILPVYAFVIGYVFLVPLTLSGPLNHETSDHFIRACEKNWWASLIFVNNFYDTKNMCMPHGWYLSLDMQLYIGAFIILWTLMRSEKLGVGIALSIIIVGMVSSGVVNYIYRLPPIFSLSVNLENVDTIMSTEYMKPHTHMSVYCIGILSGYLLAINPKLKIPKVVQPIGWCTAVIFCMSAVYGPYNWNNGVKPTFWDTLFFSSCYRTAWGLGIAWMIICCCTGHGGVINYILTWKVWIPLGRLCFLAYLLHPIVMLSYIGNIKSAIAISRHYIAVWLFFGHLVVTFAAAFAGTMLVEAPFMSLGKIMFSKAGKEVNTSNRRGGDDCENAVRFKGIRENEISTITLNGNSTQADKVIYNGKYLCRLEL